MSDANEEESESAGYEAPDERSPEMKPPTADERLIEDLFDQSRTDRSRAYELKRELDRLGVFKQYEDRFLDLFKTGD
jgi:hypothetical protein